MRRMLLVIAVLVLLTMTLAGCRKNTGKSDGGGGYGLAGSASVVAAATTWR